MGSTCSTHGERNTYKMLFRKPEWKTPLGEYRRGWEDNIKMVLRERECENLYWIFLAQDRDNWWTLMNTVMDLPFT